MKSSSMRSPATKRPFIRAQGGRADHLRHLHRRLPAYAAVSGAGVHYYTHIAESLTLDHRGVRLRTTGP